MWDHRNQWLHHKETGELITQLHADIQEQFLLGCSSLPQAERRLFRTPIQQLFLTSFTNKHEITRIWAAGLHICLREIFQHMLLA
jgi:gluconate kinase